jgi:hypothetical protein
MANDTRQVVQGVQEMTPSEAFVETLVANGVTEIFGIMGSAFMDAMDIFAPAGIKLIPVVHEQGAAHMADGFARVSGRTGVVIGQNGPGISNCVTAIAAAYWAHTPVVIVTPEAGTTGIGLGGCRCSRNSPNTKAMSPIRPAWLNTPLAASPAPGTKWGQPSSTSPATISTARSSARSPCPSHWIAVRAARAAWMQPQSCWPRPGFP